MSKRQDDTLLLLSDQSGSVLGDSTIFFWAGYHTPLPRAVRSTAQHRPELRWREKGGQEGPIGTRLRGRRDHLIWLADERVLRSR
jgi:hypothetical protein